jgi:hypothetical protein
MLTCIALALFAATLILLSTHRRQRARGGLPSGELIYSDVTAQDVPVLVSQRYGLKGKPDVLARIFSGEVVPVERKKSRAPKRPYQGDLIQAAAYLRARGGELRADSAVHENPTRGRLLWRTIQC